MVVHRSLQPLFKFQILLAPEMFHLLFLSHLELLSDPIKEGPENTPPLNNSFDWLQIFVPRVINYCS